jgi:hypothetical protein
MADNITAALYAAAGIFGSFVIIAALYPIH